MEQHFLPPCYVPCPLSQPVPEPPPSYDDLFIISNDVTLRDQLALRARKYWYWIRGKVKAQSKKLEQIWLFLSMLLTVAGMFYLLVVLFSARPCYLSMVNRGSSLAGIPELILLLVALLSVMVSAAHLALHHNGWRNEFWRRSRAHVVSLLAATLLQLCSWMEAIHVVTDGGMCSFCADREHEVAVCKMKTMATIAVFVFVSLTNILGSLSVVCVPWIFNRYERFDNHESMLSLNESEFSSNISLDERLRLIRVEQHHRAAQDLPPPEYPGLDEENLR